MPTGGAATTFVRVGVFVVIIIDAGVMAVHDFRRVVTRLTEVLRFDVADMQKPVSPDAKVHECGLDARFDIDDFAFVNVSNPIALAGSFCVEFLEDTVFEKSDSTLFFLGDVDEHFLLHRTLNFLCIDFIFVSADAEVASLLKFVMLEARFRAQARRVGSLRRLRLRARYSVATLAMP